MSKHQQVTAMKIAKSPKEEFEALKKDISENGQLEPIRTFGNKIIDGRNRYRACKELGMKPKYREWLGIDPVSFVISLNLKRRHLNSSQLAFVALHIESELAREAKRRQVRKPPSSVKEIVPEQKGQTRDHAGKELCVSGRYVSDAKMVKKAAPDLEEQVMAGDMTLPKAVNEVRKREVVERLKEIEATPVPPRKKYDVVAPEALGLAAV